MKTSIVLGAGFGDEGKGLTTSYLCSLSERPIVVRFSGGHNAGHTVVHNGHKHIFSSFGSGTLQGVPTYWSKYCTLNPTAVVNEYHALEHVPNIALYVDNMCPVTTPYDILANHHEEGLKQHGSVGVGFGKTIERHHVNNYRLHVRDLFYPYVFKTKLDLIAKEYKRQNHGIDKSIIQQFLEDIEAVKRIIIPTDSMPAKGHDHVIFEGSQGILLDQEFGFFPHVTRSHTTSRYAMDLIKHTGLQKMGEFYIPDIYYVTRSYQTRHGNGPMSNENRPVKLANNEDETNIPCDWQGIFRTGILDVDLLNYAIESDSIYAGTAKKNLVVTCLDQTGYTFKGTRDGVVYDINPVFLASVLNTTFCKLLVSSSPDSDKEIKQIQL